MQEDNGKRVLFTKGNTSIEPLNVLNQAIRTTQAEINQSEKRTNQTISDVNKIINSTFQIYSTGQEVRTGLNKQALLSASTDLQKKQIDYQNLVAQGGLIDSENISFQEKLAKKRQAYNNLQLQIAENKQLLEGQKGIFQSILGTEENYNQALSDFDNQSQNILNSAGRELSFEAKQAEIAVSIENLNAIINSVNTSNNNNQIDNIRNTAVKNLNEFEKNGYITPAEKEKTLNNLSKQINNRKVDVFINNIQDRLFKGEDFTTLKKEVINVYDLTTQGKVFNEFYGNNKKLAQADQIENETKLRNFANNLTKQILQQQAEKIVFDVPYNASTEDILATAKEMGFAENQENILNQIKQRNNFTNADFEEQKLSYDIQKGFLPTTADPSNPQIIAEYQLKNGVPYKSSLTTKNIDIFKNGYKEIGLPKTKKTNGQEIQLSNQEQLKEWYSNQYLKLGSADAIAKEAHYHLPKETAIIFESIAEGNRKWEEYGDIIEKVIVAENLGKFAIADNNKLDNEALIDFKKTNKGKYLEATNQFSELNKQAKAYRKMAEGTGKDIDDLVAKIEGDTDYVVTSNKQIKFNKQEQSGDILEGKINSILANPDIYFNLTNEYKINIDDILKAETTTKGVVSFYIYPSNGSPKYSIADYKFENLPQIPQEEINKINIDKITLESAKQELKSRNQRTEDLQNLKQNLLNPDFYNSGLDVKKEKAKAISKVEEKKALANKTIEFSKKAGTKISEIATEIGKAYKGEIPNPTSAALQTTKKSIKELETIVEKNK